MFLFSGHLGHADNLSGEEIYFSIPPYSKINYFGQHGFQSNFDFLFNKNIYCKVIYLYFRKVFLKINFSYSFCILKLNNLKIIHDLYSQYLIQIFSKTTFFSSMEFEYGGSIGMQISQQYFSFISNQHQSPANQ